MEQFPPVGARVTWTEVDDDRGETYTWPGTVVGFRTVDRGAWIRLDSGRRVLAFPEDCAPGLPAVSGLEQEPSSHVEAHAADRSPNPRLRPESPVAPGDAAALPGGPGDSPAMGSGLGLERPPAPVLAPPVGRPPELPDTTCPKCRTAFALRQEVNRGGRYSYKCVERIENDTCRRLGPTESTDLGWHICGATWLGGDAPSPVF